jgi:hypothetical protein
MLLCGGFVGGGFAVSQSGCYVFLVLCGLQQLEYRCIFDDEWDVTWIAVHAILQSALAFHVPAVAACAHVATWLLFCATSSCLWQLSGAAT